MTGVTTGTRAVKAKPRLPLLEGLLPLIGRACRPT